MYFLVLGSFACSFERGHRAPLDPDPCVVCDAHGDRRVLDGHDLAVDAGGEDHAITRLERT